jgi:hypothetical protein
MQTEPSRHSTKVGTDRRGPHCPNERLQRVQGGQVTPPPTPRLGRPFRTHEGAGNHREGGVLEFRYALKARHD